MTGTKLNARRSAHPPTSWPWPPDPQRYDRSPLSPQETEALIALRTHLKDWWRGAAGWSVLERLVNPLCEARASLHASSARAGWCADHAVAYVLDACISEGTSFWDWDRAAWSRVCGPDAPAFRLLAPWAIDSREYVIALAHLLGDFTDPLSSKHECAGVAKKMFGRDAVALALERVTSTVTGWGYGTSRRWAVPQATCTALVLRRSPDLADLSAAFIDRLHAGLTRGNRSDMYRLRRALVGLGIIDPSPWREAPPVEGGEGVDVEWKQWVERWYGTTTLGSTRRRVRGQLFRVGRWLATEHPTIRSPGDWTPQVCAAYIAHVDRMRYGDDTVRRRASLVPSRVGRPLQPRAKVQHLYAIRRFFRDCHEWEWLPRRFDPTRALRTPASIKALVGPDPRVIDDKIWAKLMWAGLNVTIDDFPRMLTGAFYPIEMLRALTLTWLFAGLRSDEIARLRVGCVRWQSNGVDPTCDEPEAGDPVCLLDIPTNKTGTAFTKPVEPLVGQAIAAWEAIRPKQPLLRDRKTGADVDLLFCYRTRRISNSYINDSIIPTLCRKAGVPREDVRGRITSHRARATIASQLYNAKDPMTLFELQAWLGHSSPHSTQHYAKVTPTTLTKAYRDAGYFARNVRVIEVLVDRDAVESGAAALGEPWQRFDLGHGYCTYDFFERCPHRMACARCEFYVPKESSDAQLLESKRNLQRMLLEIPLTDDEREAVEGDHAAVSELINRLADVPTPAGPTPRALGGARPLVMLPVVASSRQETTTGSPAEAGFEPPSSPELPKGEHDPVT